MADMELNLISVWGLILALVLLLPYGLFKLGVGKRYRTDLTVVGADLAPIFAVLGIFACFVFMVLPVGIEGGEFGFEAADLAVISFLASTALAAAAWVMWILFWVKPTRARANAITLLSAAAVLVFALCLKHWLPVIAAVVFAAAELYRLNAGNKAANAEAEEAAADAEEDLSEEAEKAFEETESLADEATKEAIGEAVEELKKE